MLRPQLLHLVQEIENNEIVSVLGDEVLSKSLQHIRKSTKEQYLIKLITQYSQEWHRPTTITIFL